MSARPINATKVAVEASGAWAQRFARHPKIPLAFAIRSVGRKSKLRITFSRGPVAFLNLTFAATLHASMREQINTIC
jgi:hypothetical protein